MRGCGIWKPIGDSSTFPELGKPFAMMQHPEIKFFLAPDDMPMSTVNGLSAKCEPVTSARVYVKR